MRSTIVYSLLISLALGWAVSAAAQDSHLVLRPGGVNRFRVEIDFGRARLSGILAARESDGEIVGAVVNEFGIKAFDFECRGGRCRLRNVVGPMDRWYVRRTVAADMRRLFCGGGRGRYEFERTDTAAVLRNVRRGISYELSPLAESGENRK